MRLDEITAQATTNSAGNQIYGGFDKHQKTVGLAGLNSKPTIEQSQWEELGQSRLVDLLDIPKFSQIASYLLSREFGKESDKVTYLKTNAAQPNYGIRHDYKLYWKTSARDGGINVSKW